MWWKCGGLWNWKKCCQISSAVCISSGLVLRSAVPAAAADKELGQIYVKWNIKTLILGNQLVRLEGTQTGQCANCALACCSLLQSQLLLQTKSKQLRLSLCLEKILLFKSHPEISDRLQPTTITSRPTKVSCWISKQLVGNPHIHV